jgi:hypothetical protein
MDKGLEAMNTVQRNKGTFFVLGIDAATWSVVTPNLSKLRNFKGLTEVDKSKVITLMEKPISASVWCGMFSGKMPEEHKHGSYVVNGEIVKREDIKVDKITKIIAGVDKLFCKQKPLLKKMLTLLFCKQKPLLKNTFLYKSFKPVLKK